MNSEHLLCIRHYSRRLSYQCTQPLRVPPSWHIQPKGHQYTNHLLTLPSITWKTHISRQFRVQVLQFPISLSFFLTEKPCNLFGSCGIVRAEFYPPPTINCHLSFSFSSFTYTSADNFSTREYPLTIRTMYTFC